MNSKDARWAWQWTLQWPHSIAVFNRPATVSETAPACLQIAGLCRADEQAAHTP
jgi:hypothetical protein